MRACPWDVTPRRGRGRPLVSQLYSWRVLSIKSSLSCDSSSQQRATADAIGPARATASPGSGMPSNDGLGRSDERHGS